MGETSFLSGERFRFRRTGDVSGSVYQAVRQNDFWFVTLEGNTDRWMFWLLSDATVISEAWWENRLTD